MPHITKQYIITKSQLTSLLRTVHIDMSKEAAAILEFLPELTGEPVAWMVTTELQDGTKRTYPATGRYEHVKDACDFGEPIPLYTHAQPLQPITAEDVTEDMRNAFRDGDDDSAFEDINKCLAAAVNA